MRKQQIKKLSLQKTRISDLAQKAIQGGNIFTNDCGTTLQITVCQTICGGLEYCRFTIGIDCS